MDYFNYYFSVFITDSSSTLKDSKYLQTPSVFPSAMTSSNNIYITTSTLTAVLSSADNFGQSSAAENRSTRSTAKKDVTTSLNNVSTSGLPHFEMIYPSKYF